MNTLIRFFRDSIWGGIGVVIGVIALGFAVYTLYDLPTKSLDITILSVSSPVQVDPSVAQDIVLTYKGKVINNLSIITVKIENTGSTEIRRDDFERLIAFTFPITAQILSTKVVDSSPKNLLHVVSDNTTSTISETLLNSGDRAIIEYIVIGLPISTTQPFDVDARIAGIQAVTIRNPLELQISNARNKLYVVIGVTGLFGIFAYILGEVVSKHHFSDNTDKGKDNHIDIDQTTSGG